MKIAVCIKRVADMETRFRIALNGTAVDDAGVKFDMGDFDSYAVEVALQLTEKTPPGEVVASSYPQASTPSIARFCKPT